MNALALRRKLIRRRGSLAAVAAALILSSVVAAHHIETPSMHSGTGMHATAAMVMCLGVLGLTAIAVAAGPRLGRLLPAPIRPADSRPPRLTPSRTAAHRSRAGPSLYLSLSVLRR